MLAGCSVPEDKWAATEEKQDTVYLATPLPVSKL